jgi:1-acyl-sn-glycerol-3-phosphate acyltransferase
MTDLSPAPSPLAPRPEAIGVDLTPEVVQRVREGVAMAQSPMVRQYIAKDLEELSAIAQGQADERVSGRFRRWVMRRFIKSFFRVRIENPQYIPTGPNVLTANHLNHLDPFLTSGLCAAPSLLLHFGRCSHPLQQTLETLVAGLGRGGDSPRTLVEGGNGRNGRRPAEGRDLKALATHPAGCAQRQLNSANAPDRPGRSGLTGPGRRRDDFPRRPPGGTEGQMHPLKRGTVLYAMRSGVPIVPVAIIGTKELYFRKRLTLRFGPPVHLPHQHRPKRRDIDASLAKLEQAFFELLPHNYQEPQGPKLFHHWLNHLFW